MKKVLVLCAAFLVMTLVSGCFWRTEIETGEMGVWMHDGVSISSVNGPGRYTDWSWFAEMKQLDITSKIVEWADPDLVSKDKQPLSLELAVTYVRTSDPEVVTRLWAVYRGVLTDDDALAKQVTTRIPRAAKAVTTKYTLDEMLGIAEGSGGREEVQRVLFAALEPELLEIGADLLDVGVNNIGVDESYMGRLREKADAMASVEVAQQRTLMLREQLEQAQAQTNIDLEVARRENLVQEEKAKVLSVSAEAFELKKIEALGSVIGETDKLIFLPEGTDLTLLLGATGVVPVK